MPSVLFFQPLPPTPASVPVAAAGDDDGDDNSVLRSPRAHVVAAAATAALPTSSPPPFPAATLRHDDAAAAAAAEALSVTPPTLAASSAAPHRPLLARLVDAVTGAWATAPSTWVSMEPLATEPTHPQQQQQQRRRPTQSAKATVVSAGAGGADWTLGRTRAEERVGLALGGERKVRVSGAGDITILPDDGGGGDGAADGGDPDDPQSWEDLERWNRANKNRDLRGSWVEARSRRAFRRFVSEALLALLIAMLGLGLAGVVLDEVQGFEVFQRVTELFILIPVILNLKGNLELNLAVRLSVASNTDSLTFRNALGNLALMQVQAIIAGFTGGLWVYVLGGLTKGGVFDSARDTFLVVSVSVITSSLSSLVSGIAMCAIVAACRGCGVDPDNIATPMAASLGDLITLLIVAVSSTLLGRFLDEEFTGDIGHSFYEPHSSHDDRIHSWRQPSYANPEEAAENQMLVPPSSLDDHDSDRRPPLSVVTAERERALHDRSRVAETGDMARDFEIADADDDHGDGGGGEDNDAASFAGDPAPSDLQAQVLHPWTTATALFFLHLPVQWLFLLFVALLNTARRAKDGSVLQLLPGLNTGGSDNATATATATASGALSARSFEAARLGTALARRADGGATSHSLSAHDSVEYAAVFVLMYTLVSGFTSLVVMWVAGALTRFCYRRGWSASVVMPVVASVADIIGTALLVGGFFMIRG
ncbi:hypothetical protein HK405_006178 [Cladochytrium tenue]|nr:hypothetical protein HK405_006178 [Cladochytrium tenue]